MWGMEGTHEEYKGNALRQHTTADAIITVTVTVTGPPNLTSSLGTQLNSAQELCFLIQIKKKIYMFFIFSSFFPFYRFTGAHAAEVLRDSGGMVSHPPHPYIILF